jgi:hypothetical protein
MKNCTQCSNLDQSGNRCKCNFYNRIIPNVDYVPIWCGLYKNTTYPSLDRALNYINTALLTTQEETITPADIQTIRASLIRAAEDIKTISLGLY